MAQRTLTLAAAALAICSAAVADVPRVATDVAPVHSLVAQVMGELGEPDLILPPGASAHGYSLRPSEARALQQADLVFWVGESLTPWLAGPIATLAGEAEVIDLIDAPGTQALAFREYARFVGPESENEDDHHAHDDHGHDAEGLDPHAWLDPENASAWIATITEVLSAEDPDNAETYRENAAAARLRIDSLTRDVAERLKRIEDLRYVVYHDAYQYFERRFDIPAVGAIAIGDATDPGAARVRQVREMIAESNVTCIATEPQFAPSLVRTVAGGADIRTTVLDPLGTNLATGPEFYGNLLLELADDLVACK